MCSFVFTSCGEPLPKPETAKLRAVELGNRDGLSTSSFPGRAEVAQETKAKAQAAFENVEANHNRSINVQRDGPGAIRQRAVDRTKAALSIAKAAAVAAISAKDIVAPFVNEGNLSDMQQRTNWGKLLD